MIYNTAKIDTSWGRIVKMRKGQTVLIKRKSKKRLSQDEEGEMGVSSLAGEKVEIQSNASCHVNTVKGGVGKTLLERCR